MRSSPIILPDRLYSLDTARGLAAFSVVIWHWQWFFYPPAGTFVYPNIDFTIQPWYALLAPLYTHGHIAVSFFFILSGFVFFWLYGNSIARGKTSVRTFLIARIARLYPLHFATLIAVYILQMIYKFDHSYFFVYQFNDFYHFALNLALVSQWGFESGLSFNGPVWSVSIEVGLYIVFFSFCYTRFHTWKYIILVLLFLQGLAYFTSGIGRWAHPLECFFVGGGTFFAVTGYITHRHRSHWTDCFILACALVAWLAFSLSTSIAGYALGASSLYSRILFPFTIAALVVAESTSVLSFRPFRLIGDLTYAVYLIHFPLSLIFAFVASRLGFGSEIFTSHFVFVIYFGVLIFVSIFVHKKFECPLQSYILRRSRFH